MENSSYYWHLPRHTTRKFGIPFLTPSVAAASVDDTLCIHSKEVTITNKGPRLSHLHMNPIPSTSNPTNTLTQNSMQAMALTATHQLSHLCRMSISGMGKQRLSPQ
eukprot:6215350-Ditylum_brightwellii.AAC.1